MALRVGPKGLWIDVVLLKETAAHAADSFGEASEGQRMVASASFP